MKRNWSLFIASRYLMTHSGRKGHLGNLLAVLGLAIGILTLITVLSVMNGFQQGFISSINEVYSYHIRVEEPGISLKEFIEASGDIANISAVVPFADHQVILTSGDGFSTGIQIRFADEQALLADTGFMDKIRMTTGNFDLSGDHTILLGADLARSVNVFTGDKVTLTFLDVTSGRGALKNHTFTVKGIFRTGYYEYDRNMAFSSLLSYPGEEADSGLVYGVKLKKHFRDLAVLKRLNSIESLKGSRMVSWRTYNSAFFNALKIEKTFMLLIVGLIFIVVAVNIFHSMKRGVRERLEELALLKAIGGTPAEIRKVYLFQGVIIGFSGVLAGTVLGILISLNINSIIELAVSAGEKLRLLAFQITGREDAYTPMSFYFTDIPVYLMLKDLVIINSAAFISVLAASWGAVRKYAAVNPAEIFRNE